MKKTIISLCFIPFIASANTMYSDVGFSRESFSFKSQDVTQSTFDASFGVKVNPYVSVKLVGSLPVSNDLVWVQQDVWYKLPGASAGDTGSTVVDTYETKAELNGRFGGGVELSYPIASNVSLTGSVVYLSSSIDAKGFELFVDNLPSSNPIQDNENIGECYATGKESFCDNPITPFDDEFSLNGFQYSVGVLWDVSRTTAFNISYRTQSEDDFKISGLQATARFRF